MEPEPEPEWQEVAPPRLSQKQLAAQQKLAAKQARDKKRREEAAAAAEAGPSQPQRQQPAAVAAAAAPAGQEAPPAGAAGVSEALRAANKVGGRFFSVNLCSPLRAPHMHPCCSGLCVQHAPC